MHFEPQAVLFWGMGGRGSVSGVINIYRHTNPGRTQSPSPQPSTPT